MTKASVNSGGVCAIGVASRGADSGTTQSAIAAGSIVIRAGDQQAQDIAGLSRDTNNANGHIDKIFDEKKIAEQQELASVFGQMANTPPPETLVTRWDGRRIVRKKRLFMVL
jgi:filamentous hemagglutinin